MLSGHDHGPALAPLNKRLQCSGGLCTTRRSSWWALEARVKRASLQPRSSMQGARFLSSSTGKASSLSLLSRLGNGRQAGSLGEGQSCEGLTPTSQCQACCPRRAETGSSGTTGPSSRRGCGTGRKRGRMEPGSCVYNRKCTSGHSGSRRAQTCPPPGRKWASPSTKVTKYNFQLLKQD